MSVVAGDGGRIVEIPENQHGSRVEPRKWRTNDVSVDI